LSYSVKAKESAQRAVRRIAREQIDKAIAEIGDREVGLHETVHQVRKRCKKVRGLLRLTRPGFAATYRRENARFRDTARLLAPLRDGHVLVATYESLLERAGDALDLAALEGVRAFLVERRENLVGPEGEREARLAATLAALHDARSGVEKWELDGEAFGVLGAGIVRTYRRGRRALAAAEQEFSLERFHEWRKRVKYHWYHLRLVRPLWKPVLAGFADEADALAARLGDEHDLGVLRRTLADHRGDLPDEPLEELFRAIDRRRGTLRAEALSVGRRSYSEKPKRMARRLHGYWVAWQVDARA